MKSNNRKQKMATDIICAIATAEGRGGVAIVRMSGEGCLEIAKKMFSRRGAYTPNMLYAGEIDGGTFRDYGMCVFFRAPKSYTGEDTVEFHCHGGREIARGILRRALDLGARMAERGEFTKRAFLNGKLSLSAAEGVADMIDAQSEAQIRAGYSLYTEKLTAEGKRLQDLLLECLAGIDADIDYPEEDLTADTRLQTKEKLLSVRGALTSLLQQYRAGKKIKEGVSVALCGAPNAGKSSLFNALLGSDRAIVSAHAGTTRDVVEGAVEINGVLFRLIDTAGLRESADDIEREGIRRAQREIDGADVIVYLKEEGDFCFPEGTPVITVGAKSDLCRDVSECDVVLSAHTGEGLDALRALIFEKGYGRESDVCLLEERHYRSVKEALTAVDDALAVVGDAPVELYAEDVKRAWEALGTLSGQTASETVINEIFEKFCVGK